jgi:hypothetical protein
MMREGLTWCKGHAGRGAHNTEFCGRVVFTPAVATVAAAACSFAGELKTAAKVTELNGCMRIMFCCCLLHAHRLTGTPQQVHAQAQLDMVSQRLDMLTTLKCCYQTVLSDPDLVADCLAFYK